jgi:hypothetical protein
MVLSDMVCGCVRGCLECCGIFLFHVLYPEGGGAAASDNKKGRQGGAGGNVNNGMGIYQFCNNSTG